MKIAAILARYILGLVFLVFGLNGFLHFIPMPPPEGLAGQFVGALGKSGFIAVVFALQLAAAVLLLINRYVPLALVLLGPILANIILFHAFLAPAGMVMPVVLLLCFVLVAYQHGPAFAGLFQPRPTTARSDALLEGR